MKIRLLAVSIIASATIFSQNAQALCGTGNSILGVDLMTKVCYECMFPFRIGSFPILNGPMPDVEGQAAAVTAPVCICPSPLPPFFRIGINFSYFLPDRFIEVVKDPGCSPSLGVQLPANPMIAGDSTESRKSAVSKHLKQQSHVYIMNIMEMLSIATDFLCMDHMDFDVAYLTEYDPLWQSDILSGFLNPEAILFGNPFANLACIPDSVSSMAFTPASPLFWCLGSHDNVYPLAGSTSDTKDLVEGSLALAEKTVYKMHRELLMWDGSGKFNYCTKIPLPVWVKGNYRFQPITPIPHPIGVVPGQTGMVWSMVKNPPIPTKMDNFGNVLFRKRGCCAGDAVGMIAGSYLKDYLSDYMKAVDPSMLDGSEFMNGWDPSVGAFGEDITFMNGL